jgi:hypothetical protein
MNISIETRASLHGEFLENCPDFIERASKLKGFAEQELEDGHEYIFDSLPQFLWLDCDFSGNIRSSSIPIFDATESLSPEIPVGIARNFQDVCTYSSEQALCFQDALMFVGTTFRDENNKITHYYSYLYDFDEVVEIVDDWCKEWKKFMLEETGCDSVEHAIAFLKSRIVTEQKQSIKKARQKEESDLEHEVFYFLENRGFSPLRQVKSGNLRMDLLIPGQLIIELKVGKVTADDVCQAINYLASHSMDVLLVGTGLTNAATRGIESVNRISGDNQLMFVTRNACFRYLNGVLGK